MHSNTNPASTLNNLRHLLLPKPPERTQRLDNLNQCIVVEPTMNKTGVLGTQPGATPMRFNLETSDTGKSNSRNRRSLTLPQCQSDSQPIHCVTKAVAGRAPSPNIYCQKHNDIHLRQSHAHFPRARVVRPESSTLIQCPLDTASAEPIRIGRNTRLQATHSRRISQHDNPRRYATLARPES